ncbi:Aste57867_4141 [Aphanomyces stellatus]|uniref:Aste57867_4141 protein n=1 Tax=Aphanomyces stellatus TaxID=120398 RepID=A0A485KDE8_9STRA|nr:hypothetical protein As57867_004130 [Aphanomyces stellatus]VFT81268.1 Aste57867_4141 [Aphanomyces stellatus]
MVSSVTGDRFHHPTRESKVTMPPILPIKVMPIARLKVVKPVATFTCATLFTPKRSTQRQDGQPTIRFLGGRVTLHAPMHHRDPNEAHRGSSALEKLFDLTLVVALSAVSRQFGTNIVQRPTDIWLHIVQFLKSFFLIWNTWFPFVWFATTYDVDDVCFRLATLGEMAGVLMISDGIEHATNTEILHGYIVLRFFHVFCFRFRAAVQDPLRRAVNVKYGVATIGIMVAWSVQQTYATTFASDTIGFACLALCDLAAPYIAQTTSTHQAKYHPQHISDRYAEFTIIVIGESILSLSHATTLKSSPTEYNLEAISTCVASLVLLFALWWVYFIVPFGAILHDNPSLKYTVAYGHFFIHASLAAFATGIYVAGLATQPPSNVNPSDEATRRRVLLESPVVVVSVSTAAYVIASSATAYLVSIPLMLHFPTKILVRNSLVSLGMVFVAVFATSHVNVGRLLWLFCIPLMCLLGHIMATYRVKTPKLESPTVAALSEWPQNPTESD